MNYTKLTCLTQRERETLELMAQGLDDYQIAREFVVSITTVKTHIANIFDKIRPEIDADRTCRGKSALRIRAVLWYLKQIHKQESNCRQIVCEIKDLLNRKDKINDNN